jgi:hypothetical protein
MRIVCASNFFTFEALAFTKSSKTYANVYKPWYDKQSEFAAKAQELALLDESHEIAHQKMRSFVPGRQQTNMDESELDETLCRSQGGLWKQWTRPNPRSCRQLVQNGRRSATSPRIMAMATGIPSFFVQ